MTAERAPRASGRIAPPIDVALVSRRLERLRALDRRLVSAAELPDRATPPPRSAIAAAAAARAQVLAAALDGRTETRPEGAVVVVESTVRLPFDPRSLATLPFPIESDRPFLLLDTETTALGTAAGTLAFLVGLAWWEGVRLRIRQLWLPDQPDEPALLLALETALPTGACLVTYNGRTFDWPLLATRYRLLRRAPPEPGAHLDLLPIARRLWRHRLSDARLATVERGVARVHRQADLPGALIPERYFRYLRTGDPCWLPEIGEHNRHDLVSMARLLVILATELGTPEARAEAHPGDVAALGRAYRRQGRHDEALACFATALESSGGPAWAIPAAVDARSLTLEQARLLARLGRRHEALATWRSLAAGGGRVGILASIAVARELEHHAHDLPGALAAAQRATDLLARRHQLGLALPEAERDLPRRLRRLRRRLALAYPAAASAAARRSSNAGAQVPTIARSAASRSAVTAAAQTERPTITPEPPARPACST